MFNLGPAAGFVGVMPADSGCLLQTAKARLDGLRISSRLGTKSNKPSICQGLQWGNDLHRREAETAADTVGQTILTAILLVLEERAR